MLYREKSCLMLLNRKSWLGLMLNIIIKMESWIIKFNQIKHGQINPPQIDYLTFMIHPKISVKMILRKGRNPIQQI